MSDVLEIIEPLANILEIDIDIIDKHGMRLAGTGIYKHRIGATVNEIVYENILKNKELTIVENPKYNINCIGCANSFQCMKKFIMGIPLYSKQEVVGIILFLSFSQEKRDDILKKIENYSRALKTLSETVATKIFNYKYNEIYKELYLNMSRGVIITDDKEIIVDHNRAAHVMFPELRELIKKKIFYSEVSEGRYKLMISGIEINIVGKINITSDGKRCITFKKVENIEEEALFDRLLIGKSRVIINLKNRMKKISKLDSPILIKGDIGTDKDMFAKVIHNFSNRVHRKYMSINCRDEKFDEIGTKIFGNDKEGTLIIGKIEAANGGTFFIDEIEHLSISHQKKLLHFLKTSKITSDCGNHEVELDVRIIVGTKANLLELVNRNIFLENLYYAISAVEIEVPSFKYRRDDIEEIVEYLVKKYSTLLNKQIKGIDPKVIKIFEDYEWKGNWKEVESTVKLMVELSENNSIITPDLIPEEIKLKKENYIKGIKKVRKLSEIEREEIVLALSQFGMETEGKKKAAIKLGIGIATLYRKIEFYQIDKKEILNYR